MQGLITEELMCLDYEQVEYKIGLMYYKFYFNPYYSCKSITNCMNLWWDVGCNMGNPDLDIPKFGECHEPKIVEYLNRQKNSWIFRVKLLYYTKLDFNLLLPNMNNLWIKEASLIRQIVFSQLRVNTLTDHFWTDI